MGAKTGEFIEVVGARQNNLKGINLKLPLGELIVVTGVGGDVRDFSLCVAVGIV